MKIRTLISMAAAAWGILSITGSGSARAGLFAGGAAGFSLLSEEGNAPPLCCNERETWTAPGGRIGGRVGYDFRGPLFLRLDAGLAAHHATTGDGSELTVWSPDVGLMFGGKERGPRVTADLGLGVGWRRFSGSVDRAGGPTGTPDRTIDRGAPDLRAAAGVHGHIGRNQTLGAELAFAKVLIDQHVTTLSLVWGWDAVPR